MPDTLSPVKPAVGQIWREVDPRFERFAKVFGTSPNGALVYIQTVYKHETGAWWLSPRSRTTAVKIERFNGKRGGYEFVEAPR
jgi:hypothetical protein